MERGCLALETHQLPALGRSLVINQSSPHNTDRKPETWGEAWGAWEVLEVAVLDEEREPCHGDSE